MRLSPAIIGATVLLAGIGCAKHPSTRVERPSGLRDRPASALVFTPAIALAEPEIDLARDVRQPAAFVGFEEPTATFFAVRSDDRQTSDGTDRFVRRAVSVKVGVTHR